MKSFINKTAVFIASGFNAGYLPIGPGTWGAGTMAVAAWWLVDLPLVYYLAVIVFLFFLGAAVSGPADSYFSIKSGKAHDNDQIVIDEWMGMLITLLPFYYFGKSLPMLIVGFLLFRVFDTVKIGLVALADRIDNRWGVMIDDLAAGLYAGIFFFLAIWFTKII
ncbi:MAG: phosphatidylglycerophosphatase A [Patescibacteria group bacterium]|jgi:phosphatidylglycerophosphatase A